MKITDLFEETVSGYFSRLVKLKIKKLGSGAFSTVFRHPTMPNVAVKVFRKPDPGYLDFAKRCAKIHDNPWLPQILDIKKVRYDEWPNPMKKDLHIIFTKRYEPASKKEIKSAKMFILDTMSEYDHLPIFDELEEYLFFCDGFQAVDTKQWGYIKKYTNDPKIKELASVLQNVQAIDTHTSNLMKDPSKPGFIVFVDPVAELNT